MPSSSLRIYGILTWTVFLVSCGPQPHTRTPKNKLTHDKVPSRSPKITEEDLVKKRNQALRFARSGKHKEALAGYLFVFDNSRDSPRFRGTRLSFLLGQIVDLGQQYTRALQTLRARRDRCGREILSGRASELTFSEYESINWHLGEGGHAVRLYDALTAKGANLKKTREHFAKRVWQDLARAKRHKALASSAGTIAFHAARKVAMVHLKPELHPDYIAVAKRLAAAKIGVSDFSKVKRNSIRDGILAYQVLLALKQEQLADKMKRWLLRFKKDPEIYRWLIEAATGVNNRGVGMALVKEAGAQFPGARFELPTKAQEKAKEEGAARPRTRRAIISNAEETSLRKAIKRSPNHIPSYDRYATFLMANKRYREGVSVCKAGLSRKPDSKILRAQLGAFYYQLKKIRTGYPLLRLDADNDSLCHRFEIQASRSRCCIKMKDFACAKKAIDCFLKYRPSVLSERDFFFYTLRAKASAGLHDCEGAIRDAKKALRLKSDYQPAKSIKCSR